MLRDDFMLTVKTFISIFISFHCFLVFVEKALQLVPLFIYIMNMNVLIHHHVQNTRVWFCISDRVQGLSFKFQHQGKGKMSLHCNLECRVHSFTRKIFTQQCNPVGVFGRKRDSSLMISVCVESCLNSIQSSLVP